jgi:hypothetical protein
MRWIFSTAQSFQPYYGPVVDSASNRNEYPESTWGKGRPARKADFNDICEPTVYNMWAPRRLTTLWASTAWYTVSFTFYSYCIFTQVHMTRPNCLLVIFSSRGHELVYVADVRTQTTCSCTNKHMTTRKLETALQLLETLYTSIS